MHLYTITEKSLEKLVNKNKKIAWIENTLKLIFKKKLIIKKKHD